ncbi:FadR/GntR family transcriptional regulator [Sphingomonas sp.]|uniref:FadR/GntR family transcriptional regulator n=1 Tax=Sphingomonas sp. TaxID=28214 RepID=UPI002CD3B6E1|nr:FadR/GntR family transcriptional regulator [Sphingomonas sp.]HTG38969.1 FadR/GntR family transcriptional regulator [Sphingomonas sp.]
MTRTVRREPSHVRIAKQLGVAIVTGELPSGSFLPGEIELSGQFDVSRSVMRESLRILVSKGLLQSRPKAGTHVTARRDWNLLDPTLLFWMFEGVPPRSFVRDLFQLRMIVEPAAAELAAGARTARQLSHMGHALERMGELGLRDEAGQLADRDFHDGLLQATHNELLVNLSASIAAAVHWTTYFKYRSNRTYSDPMPLHRNLYEAIADRDGPAARASATALIDQARIDTEAALSPP